MVVVISLLVVCRVGCLLYGGLMALVVSVLNSVGRGLAGLLRLAGWGCFGFVFGLAISSGFGGLAAARCSVVIWLHVGVAYDWMLVGDALV